MSDTKLNFKELEAAFELVQGDLITRKELVTLTGVSSTKIANISHSKFLDFPKPVTKIGREQAWNRAEVMAWLETHDVHAELPWLSLSDKHCQSTLDNRLATEFLTAKYKNTHGHD